jgi:Icc-related predicted phosphoesterase
MAKAKSKSRDGSLNTLTMVLLSDTHGLHRELSMPAADVFLHAGDICMLGDRSAIRDFDRWLGELGYRHCILVPGNHDSPILEDPSLVSNAVVLINQGIEIDGLRIWGTPGGVVEARSVEERRRLYSMIPMDTDVLITHGPAYSILDSAPRSDHHGGDQELREAVERVRPRLHLCGHVHPGRGSWETEHTVYVNGALLSELGDVNPQPTVMRMAKKSLTKVNARLSAEATAMSHAEREARVQASYATDPKTGQSRT